MKKRAVSVTLHLYLFGFWTSFSISRPVCPERSASFSFSRTTASVRCTVFLRDTRCPLVINLSVAASFFCLHFNLITTWTRGRSWQVLLVICSFCSSASSWRSTSCALLLMKKTRSPAGFFSLYYFFYSCLREIYLSKTVTFVIMTL